MFRPTTLLGLISMAQIIRVDIHIYILSIYYLYIMCERLDVQWVAI